MYERMLDKQKMPTMQEMTDYCGDSGKAFVSLNEWLTSVFATQQETVFPYGNKYGWGIAHKKNKKLICNIFAEKSSFTVMLRLSNAQFDAVYSKLQKETQTYIDNKYPCSDGGWIHYRVTGAAQYEDICTLLSVKLS